MTERYKIAIGNSGPGHFNERYRVIHNEVVNVFIPYKSPDDCFSKQDIMGCGMFSEQFIDEYISYALENHFIDNATQNQTVCRRRP